MATTSTLVGSNGQLFISGLVEAQFNAKRSFDKSSLGHRRLRHLNVSSIIFGTNLPRIQFNDKAIWPTV